MALTDLHDIQLLSAERSLNFRQPVWAQIMACDIRGEGAVSHYHCDPFNGGGLLFKEQEWL